jgi:hypothetical protein
MLRDLIKPYIDRIRRREVTNRAVAAELGVTEFSVCRVLKQLKVVREEAPNSKAKKDLNEARRQHRLKAAQTMDVKAAAQAANCSIRTIYRLRNKK